jgi:hypothetical protein
VVKLVAAFLPPLCMNASLIVSGNAPGMLAMADLTIPANPNAQVVPMMRMESQGSWSGSITVDGSSGDGFLEFDVEAMATSFNGSPSSEYMQSWSSVTAPFQVSSPGWMPQGSTPANCYCYLPFTFGQPKHVTFTGSAYSSYTFFPMIAGVPPYLAGGTIHSAAQVWLMGA